MYPKRAEGTEKVIFHKSSRQISQKREQKYRESCAGDVTIGSRSTFKQQGLDCCSTGLILGTVTVTLS